MYTNDQLDAIEEDEEKNRLSIRLKRIHELFKENYGG